jgi:hypothetical protein
MRLNGSLRRSGLFIAALFLVMWPKLALSTTWREQARLRSDNPAIARLIARADQRSITFHGLLEGLARTDGVVYIATGLCGHGVRACMPHSIARSESFRLLRILIDPQYANIDDAHLTGIIGHELQHALEILSDPRITSAAAMFNFYKRDAPASGAFETAKAILVGDRIADEMVMASRDELKLAENRPGL